MTKVLYVFGDDYAACDFEKLWEQGVINPSDLWANSDAEGLCEFETEREYFQYEAHEFTYIDPKFIDFVKSNQDYDESKSANFYIVGD